MDTMHIYRFKDCFTFLTQDDDDDDDFNEFDAEETGLECVICMCEMRDTLILPCRHLCLCRACGKYETVS